MHVYASLSVCMRALVRVCLDVSVVCGCFVAMCVCIFLYIYMCDEIHTNSSGSLAFSNMLLFPSSRFSELVADNFLCNDFL